MKSYAIVGMGGRAMMYTSALVERAGHNVILHAICDRNEGRLSLAAKELSAPFPHLACYGASDFDKMLINHKPDYLIVCTVDANHDDYICRALKAGVDVITEKPMTTDEYKCQKIIDTVKETGKNVRVMFNYRYSPPRSQIKEILMSGLIGRVLSVNFQWVLDTNHGADYFRRWHRNKANSGGLLVHKACHHFDILNWWLGSVPETVYAEGRRVFYNSSQASRYGLDGHGERCLNCSVSDRCNYYLDMNSEELIKELYLDNEKYDDYHRDACIFSEDIDIEDSVDLIAKYKNGPTLSYSLTAFSPWEGYRVIFNGTKGRLEHNCQESSYISGDGSIQGASKPDGTDITVYPHFKSRYQIDVNQGIGSHGGGDILMLSDLFDDPVSDPLQRSADYTQGAYSVLMGIAANKSIVSQKKVRIADLVTDLAEPNYPANRNNDEEIRYVANTKCISSDGKEISANIPSKQAVLLDE
jgi:predicted dehydrogenase